MGFEKSGSSCWVFFFWAASFAPSSPPHGPQNQIFTRLQINHSRSSVVLLTRCKYRTTIWLLWHLNRVWALIWSQSPDTTHTYTHTTRLHLARRVCVCVRLCVFVCVWRRSSPSFQGYLLQQPHFSDPMGILITAVFLWAVVGGKHPSHSFTQPLCVVSVVYVCVCVCRALGVKRRYKTGWSLSAGSAGDEPHLSHTAASAGALVILWEKATLWYKQTKLQVLFH